MGRGKGFATQVTPGQLPSVEEARAQVATEEAAALANMPGWRGEVLRAIEHRGVSQVQLARMVGVHRPAMSRFLSRRPRNPSVETLQKVADALGCELTITIKPKAGLDWKIPESAITGLAAAVVE